MLIYVLEQFAGEGEVKSDWPGISWAIRITQCNFHGVHGSIQQQYPINKKIMDFLQIENTQFRTLAWRDQRLNRLDLTFPN